MSAERLEELAKLAYEEQRRVMSAATFRPWEGLHRKEQEAWRAAAQVIIDALKVAGG